MVRLQNLEQRAKTVFAGYNCDSLRKNGILKMDIAALALMLSVLHVRCQDSIKEKPGDAKKLEGIIKLYNEKHNDLACRYCSQKACYPIAVLQTLRNTFGHNTRLGEQCDDDGTFNGYWRGGYRCLKAIIAECNGKPCDRDRMKQELVAKCRDVLQRHVAHNEDDTAASQVLLSQKVPMHAPAQHHDKDKKA
jgi:hypothetical protein